MLIFNTTYHVEDNSCPDYVDFMKTIYIPQASDSGFLHEPRFSKIHAQHEQTGVSYSLQFRVKNMDTLNYWFSGEGDRLNKLLLSRFGNQVAGFVTIMEEIGL